MKTLMMNTIYEAIDTATTQRRIHEIDGMLEMFFLMINTNDITHNDFLELCNARDRRFQKIVDKEI